jgi:protease-4
VKRLALLAVCAAHSAGAQERYAEDPFEGLHLPAAPLAGDHDATATVMNPAGLPFLGGTHLEVAATSRPGEGVQSAGAGVGGYLGFPIELPLLPRLGLGLALEKLVPPSAILVPDPGRPLRLSLGLGLRAGDAALGVSWHSNHGEGSGALDGTGSFDLGIAMRLGARLAAGAVLRNLFPASVGALPTERRYDVELVARPVAHDRLELAVAAAIGERRGTIDPRARASLRLARGLALKGEVEWRTHLDADVDADRREVVGSVGLEVSFGHLGAAGYATLSSGPDDTRLAGATTIVRLSGERYPSVVPRGERIERVKLGGDLDERALTRTLLALRRHEKDPGVRAVFLHFDGLSATWGTLEELRDAVGRLRARGKRVFAYLVAGGTRDYYVAAACDKVLLDAAGGLRLLGLSSTSLHVKETFDKLGVTPQFEKIEEWKSAPEMFTMQTPSPEAELQRAALLDDIYRRVVAGIAAGRKISEERARELLDRGPYTAAEAVQAGAADALVEPTDLDKLLLSELGDGIELGEGPLSERPLSWRLPRIAVIYLEGDIVDGKSKNVPLIGQKVAGGETLASALTRARQDDGIRAVVLRINSPGGSALASEQIARAGFRLRGVKPFVVSIGDIAASGGYFAAAPGDVIYAEPSSVTGSIGIFTGKFDLSGMLSRLGVSWQTMTRGPHADMESFLRPYTDEERAAIKEKLHYYYGRFTGAVARGRGMSEADVDAVGRGRVWTAAQARERRLVDRFGGLIDALAEAKKRAGLDEDDPVELVLLPREPTSLLGRLLRLGGADGDAEAESDVHPLAPLLRRLPASLLLEPGAMQARLPMMWLD